MINGEDWIEASHDRLLGYRQALTTHDVAVDPALMSPVAGPWLVAVNKRIGCWICPIPPRQCFVIVIEWP